MVGAILGAYLQLGMAPILQRNSAGYYLDLADGGRVRAWDVQHNALSLSFRRRVDDPDRLATLTVRYDGEQVLVASWTIDGFSRRSFKPGPWKNSLRRYDRIPALAGRPQFNAEA
jgi:hypothetical protein